MGLLHAANSGADYLEAALLANIEYIEEDGLIEVSTEPYTRLSDLLAGGKSCVVNDAVQPPWNTVSRPFARDIGVSMVAAPGAIVQVQGGLFPRFRPH